MKTLSSFLVNITKHGRHVALLSTHDGDFIETVLKPVLTNAGYEMQVDSTPSPLGKGTK